MAIIIGDANNNALRGTRELPPTDDEVFGLEGDDTL